MVECCIILLWDARVDVSVFGLAMINWRDVFAGFCSIELPCVDPPIRELFIKTYRNKPAKIAFNA